MNAPAAFFLTAGRKPTAARTQSRLFALPRLLASLPWPRHSHCGGRLVRSISKHRSSRAKVIFNSSASVVRVVKEIADDRAWRDGRGGQLTMHKMHRDGVIAS